MVRMNRVRIGADVKNSAESESYLIRPGRISDAKPSTKLVWRGC